MTHITVKTERIGPVNALVYTYWLAPGYGFRHNLLCEVGYPWYDEAKQKAEALAARRGGVIKQVELSARPWLVDAIVKEAA